MALSPEVLRKRVRACGRAQSAAKTEMVHMFPKLYRELYVKYRDRGFKEIEMEMSQNEKAG